MFAQSEATLSVKLAPIQVIEVNPDQSAVVLDYENTIDYIKGNLMNSPDHLRMYSTGGFVVKVEAADLYGEGIDYGMLLPEIVINPRPDKFNSFEGMHIVAADLTPFPTTIIRNDKGAINKTFGIEYLTKDESSQINNTDLLIGSPRNVTIILYSIEIP